MNCWNKNIEILIFKILIGMMFLSPTLLTSKAQGSTPLGACSTAGVQRYDSGDMQYCDGSNWYSMRVNYEVPHTELNPCSTYKVSGQAKCIYTYTGAAQDFDVSVLTDAGINSITAVVNGAGGGGSKWGKGGDGGQSTGNLDLTSYGGDLKIVVGGGGKTRNDAVTTHISPGDGGGAGGWPGGGEGGPGRAGGSCGGGGGGGYTGIFNGTVSHANSLIIAGAGGGASSGAYGGNGGGASGVAGFGCCGGRSSGVGTQGGGGAAGNAGVTTGATNGGALSGGRGHTYYNASGYGGGGGGGAGYYGAGGGWTDSAAAGGSGYTGGTGVSGASMTAGGGSAGGVMNAAGVAAANGTDGTVEITWTAP